MNISRHIVGTNIRICIQEGDKIQVVYLRDDGEQRVLTSIFRPDSLIWEGSEGLVEIT